VVPIDGSLKFGCYVVWLAYGADIAHGDSHQVLVGTNEASLAYVLGIFTWVI